MRKRLRILGQFQHARGNERGILRLASAERQRHATDARVDRFVPTELTPGSHWRRLLDTASPYSPSLASRQKLREMQSTVAKNFMSTFRIGIGLPIVSSTKASSSRIPRLSIRPVSNSGVDASISVTSYRSPSTACAPGSLMNIDERTVERLARGRSITHRSPPRGRAMVGRDRGHSR